jgi:hypothetical protein
MDMELSIGLKNKETINIWEIDIKDNLKMENDKVTESFFMQMEEYMKVIGIMI